MSEEGEKQEDFSPGPAKYFRLSEEITTTNKAIRHDAPTPPMRQSVQDQAVIKRATDYAVSRQRAATSKAKPTTGQ